MRGFRAAALVTAGLLTAAAALPAPSAAQGRRSRIHVSVTLSGHILLGVGYTRWVHEYHALEATVFPLAIPGNGFPFGFRAGYAWVPSAERWRAKLGAGILVLVSPSGKDGRRILPLPTFSPGIRYEADPGDALAMDLWLSYFPGRGLFVPTGLEFRYGRGL